MEMDKVKVRKMIGEVVMPGDVITEASELAKTKRLVFGPGLRIMNEMVVVTKPGILHQKKNSFWVDYYQKRYVPIRGETVIGVVVGKSGDTFRVDIGTHDQANLSYLAFEGATKKNRPDVNIGDVIFAKLMVANKDLEPELACVDSLGKKGKLGVLKGGLVFTCSINLARKISKENCPLFPTMEKEIPFEVATGLNGRIWINAPTINEIMAFGTAILAAENASNEDIKEICRKIGNKLRKN